MFRCCECGATFAPEEAGTHNEFHTLDGVAYPERWAACPVCGQIDLEYVGQCPICGECSNGSCGTCRDEIKSHLDQLVDMAPTRDGKEAVLDEIQNYVEDYEE